ncbi:MAG: type VI secretion system tip protein VgrG [Polyangiaceae bacterium]|nr:type VI secretion system tip protein VgrG [Polyangiaceae bacterium]
MSERSVEKDYVYATLEVDGVLPDTLHVTEVQGVEKISSLYQFDVSAVTTAHLDPESFLGSRAVLTFHRGEKVVRHVHGVIRSVQDGTVGPDAPWAFQFQLVPGLTYLTLRETLDVFMDMSVPTIIEKKLAQLTMTVGEHFECRLYGNHTPREFIVQYKETDLAFLSRLTEHFGMSFFFEQAEKNERLIVTDENYGFRPIAGIDHIPFRQRGDRRDIYQCDLVRQLIPSKMVVRDYNYRNPQLDLTATASLDGDGGMIVEYGAHVKTVEEANRIAQIRGEEQLAGRQVYTGESDLPNLFPGGTALLDGHPHGDLDLLFTQVEHHLTQPGLGGGGQYKMVSRFKAIRKSTPFRPARSTPKPKVGGVLTGIVESRGEDKYAEIDDQGRYRVRFSFDTSGAGEAQASRPLRMMQPHAGAGYGMHFPLRAGTEVLIVCVDGDPDRPIIAGTVPNPTMASPVVAGNSKRNIIRTGGANEINIDDSDGGERIKITTPRKNTVLQLGAPNDPIDGVSVKTEGHSTVHAQEGASQVAAYGMTMSAILDLLRSPTIVNIAAFPGLLPIMGAAGSAADFVYQSNARRIEAERQDILKEESEKNERAIAASQAAKKKALECVLCRTKAQALIPPKPTVPPASQSDLDAWTAAWEAVSTAAAEYNAAAVAADDGYLTAIGTMEDRNGIIDANRTNFLNANFEPVMQRDAMAAVAEYDYVKYTDVMLAADKAEYAALSEAQKQGITEAEWLAERQLLWAPEPDGGDLKTQRDQKKAALDNALQTAINAAPNGSAAKAALQAYQSELQKCVALCGSQLDAARLDAIEKNDEFANAMRDNTMTLQELQREQNKNIKPELTKFNASINILLTVFAAIETIVAKRATKERWRKAATAVVDAHLAGADDVQGVVNNIASRPWYQPHYTNIVGSDMTAEVFGQEDAVVWSKTAMLLGMGSTKRTTTGLAGMGVAGGVIGAPLPGEKPDPSKGKALVVGMEAAHVISKGTAVLHGNLASEVVSKTRASIYAKNVGEGANPPDDNEQSKMDFSIGEARLAVNDGAGEPAVSMKASLANNHGVMEIVTSNGPELKMNSDTKAMELRASAAFKLLLDRQNTFSELSGGQWKLKLHAGPNNGVTLGQDNAWRLKLKHQEVDIGLHGGAGPQLKLTHQDGHLTAGHTLHLTGPQSVQFVAQNVQFGGAQLVGANLLVKGVVEGQIAALQGQAAQANATANAAQQAANQSATQAGNAYRLADAAYNSTFRYTRVPRPVDQ